MDCASGFFFVIARLCGFQAEAKTAARGLINEKRISTKSFRARWASLAEDKHGNINLATG